MPEHITEEADSQTRPQHFFAESQAELAASAHAWMAGVDADVDAARRAAEAAEARERKDAASQAQAQGTLQVQNC